MKLIINFTLDWYTKPLKQFEGDILSLVQGASGNNYAHWMLDFYRIKIVIIKNVNSK